MARAPHALVFCSLQVNSAPGDSELGLHRVQGRHFTRNAASGRVMQKLGMQFEGTHRGAFCRWERSKMSPYMRFWRGSGMWPNRPTPTWTAGMMGNTSVQVHGNPVCQPLMM